MHHTSRLIEANFNAPWSSIAESTARHSTAIDGSEGNLYIDQASSDGPMGAASELDMGATLQSLLLLL